MARLICIYLFCLLLPAPKPDDIRHKLTLAINSSKITDSLYKSLANIKDKPPVVISYMGALEALKAKHAWNPYSKLKYINRSEKTFVKAIAADPHNIEIRFLRFSVEHNLPGFLCDNKQLLGDREEIIALVKKEHYNSNDKSLVIAVVKFLLGSKRCTPAENAYLSDALTRLQ